MSSNIVKVTETSRLRNRILIEIIKNHEEEITDTRKSRQHTTKRSKKSSVAEKVYNTFVNENNGRFEDEVGNEISEMEAIEFIKKRLMSTTRQSTLKKLHGICFNDFARGENGEKVQLTFLPLIKPDEYIDEKGVITKLDNNQETCELYHKHMKGKDGRKFCPGNNHYVNGYYYSNLPEKSRVHIIDYDSVGKTDVEFKIAGTDEMTRVRVRKLDQSHELLQQNSKVMEKLTNNKIHVGGNARRSHNTHMKNKHFMFSMFQNTKEEKNDVSAIVSKWNETEPKDFTAKMFGQMLESAIASEFCKTLDKVKEIEDDVESNYIGNFAHSIDISVNLVNAGHFDMGDAGYGCGVWISSDGKDNEGWYFVLPNASVKGSMGVAIKLNHGIMIEWNGTKIKHCSSMPITKDNQTLFGTFIGPKKKYSKTLKKSREEPCIPKDFNEVCDIFTKISKSKKK